MEMKETYIGLQEMYDQKKMEMESNIKNLYLRRRYAKLRAKGICVRCMKKMEDNKHSLCEGCIIKKKELYKKSRGG